MDTKKIIEAFINDISCKYSFVRIGYSYDDTLDEYDIWHTSQDLEFYDKDFKKYVAEKAREYLFENNIYNFSFGYDYQRHEELEGTSKFQMAPQHYNITFKVKKKTLDEEFKYTCNYNIKMKNSQSHINFKESNKTIANNYESISDSRINIDNTTYQSNKFREAA